MRYPVYPTQPNSGCLPPMADMGPFDLMPSSSTAPHYQRRFDAMYGRHLAGYGEVEKAADEVVDTRVARNEIAVMEELDDSSGSGIFDRSLQQRNVHQGSGIFADRMAMPGYVQRDPLYTQSEVRSVTTGRAVTYVNGGSAPLDDRAKIAFLENQWSYPTSPAVRAQVGTRVPSRSIANVRQNPTLAAPTAGLGAIPPVVNFALAAGAIGLAAGAIVGLLRRRAA